MLFKQKHLEGIKNGSIDLAFRRWKKPTVKAGSVVNTAIGQIEIVSLHVVNTEDISWEEAEKAGYSTLTDLTNSFYSNEGDTYKIKLRFYAVDPRIALRNNSDITAEEYMQIKTKLERLDQYSKMGDWTIQVLELIKDNPKLRAADLARNSGWEKEWLKTNIRKLKNLGLTISHEVGYEISPRGLAYLQMIA